MKLVWKRMYRRWTSDHVRNKSRFIFTSMNLIFVFLMCPIQIIMISFFASRVANVAGDDKKRRRNISALICVYNHGVLIIWECSILRVCNTIAPIKYAHMSICICFWTVYSRKNVLFFSLAAFILCLAKIKVSWHSNGIRYMTFYILHFYICVFFFLEFIFQSVFELHAIFVCMKCPLDWNRILIRYFMVV